MTGCPGDLITEITNEARWRMRQQGLTTDMVARRMGISPGRLSQILSGGENLTIRTIEALARALGGRFTVELEA